MDSIFSTDIKYLPGMDAKKVSLVKHELDVHTYGDFLQLYPFRYIDRTRIYTVREALSDESLTLVQIKVRIDRVAVVGEGAKRRFVATAYDSTGWAELVWFKAPKWIVGKVEVGREYIAFGRPAIFNGWLSMAHPELEVPITESANRKSVIYGVYSSSEKLTRAGITSRSITRWMHKLLTISAAKIEETLPDYIIERFNLLDRRSAVVNVHFPQSNELLARAQYRLKFEEFLALQLSILKQRNVRVARGSGFVFSNVGEKFNRYYNECLEFELTGAQKRVIRQVRADTLSGNQMNRLLQGDVGSGKTVVGLMCMLLAVDNGFQAAMMAPTEILATQHYESLAPLCQKIGVRVALLTGSTKKRARSKMDEELLSGEIDILIGTHALIEDRVRFANLGFVIIDEQHRFGVVQRSRLWTKNEVAPHVLVMTATPIPRTLAMTIYGDLDVSVIDELPPGRKPIKTMHFFESNRLQVFGFMREQIAKGRQVYVVHPLIKESEKMDYSNVEQGYERIVSAFPPPDYTTVIVHGKMKQSDKDYGMSVFKDGQADIMIATSVIEVGVNVPNASVMVIESAERFGLSQLHQLRGRVG
ncbi:MAG: ATP-dependent DNA helicase RecG, partial [Rikenellaceae bacterium]|nr:ATP-dependent DNA helicase RecG [Rikenellaceae bacterium]